MPYHTVHDNTGIHFYLIKKVSYHDINDVATQLRITHLHSLANHVVKTNQAMKVHEEEVLAAGEV